MESNNIGNVRNNIIDDYEPKHKHLTIKSQKLPASSGGSGLEGKTDSLVKQVKKVGTGELVPVSTARELGGKRVYHLKSDLLPWMTNMYESGKRSNDAIFSEFEKLINENSDISLQEKASLINAAGELRDHANRQLVESMEKTLAEPELSKELNSALIPDKEIVQKYKDMSKSIQKSIHDNIKSFVAELEKIPLPPPQTLKDSITFFTKEMEKNIENIEGLKRFEIIHEDKFWDPKNITTRYMVFSNEDRNIVGISTFQAKGPGYSSQAPRNREEKYAFAANFVESTFSVKEPGRGKEPKLLLEVTRSAITVEFDQANPQERKKCNRKLVRQVLDNQIEHRLKSVSSEELNKATNRHTPFLFKAQTVNLLTPDIMRSIVREHEFMQGAGSYFHMTGAPADDERALMLENIETHQALDGKVIAYPMQNEHGEHQTIYIKLDLRYFNIPNNSMYIQTPKFLTDSEVATACNQQSWKKLEADVKQNVLGLTKEINHHRVSLPPDELQILDTLIKKEKRKNRMRRQIVADTVAKGLSISKNAFISWQKLADEVALDRLRLEKDANFSPEFKALLPLVKQRDQLISLYWDTEELFSSGLSKNVTNMDNNRSALATRIILLAALVEDIEVHFGCRSGKDRTGLVDVELKLLLTEGELNGRLPSYREQERLKKIVNHRETMTMESGNSYDFVKANLGAALGLNTGGSASDPLEQNEAGKQYQEFTQAAQAFAAMASRPPTNWQVPPAKFNL